MSIHGQFVRFWEYEAWLVPWGAVCGGAREVNKLRDAAVFLQPMHDTCGVPSVELMRSMQSSQHSEHVQRVGCSSILRV